MRGENLIIGDFNFPGVRWESGCCDSRGRPFYDACSDAFLTQHVEGATHLSGNTLDLVLSSDPSLVRGVEMIGRIGASDHETLLVDVPLDALTRRASYTMRNFNKANFGEMRRELIIDWEAALSGLSVDSMWTSIKSRINGTIEKFVPLKRIGLNRKPKWLNHEILMLIGKKRKAWSRWKECRSAENEREYKNLEKLVKRRIRNSKNNTERRVAKDAKENPKAFFSYVNSSKKTRVKIGPLKDRSGEIVTDPLEQAGILNAHYATVFTRSMNDLPVVESSMEEVIDDVDVSIERVKNTIDELKEISAPGPDNIGNKVIMELKEQLALPFSILFRKSLNDAEVPEEWKDSVVSPIFKKGVRSDPGNYRPVSLTCNTCKLLEKIIKGEVESHMERHILSNSQHGFRRGRSPQTNLIEFMDHVTKWLDEGKSVDVIYFDFSKAFDKVCHKRLAVKMEAAGIRGKVKEWVCEWLRGRRQKVVVDGMESDWEDVVSGVPQGSVLGGTLFVLYVNDIDEGLGSFSRKFADDTKCARVVETVEDAEALQRDIDVMVDWARKWEMQFNVAKCKVLHIGRRNREFTYTMDGVPLVEVKEEKDLGVWIQSDLKPGSQCERAAKAANATLGLITRSFHYRTKSILVPLYKVFVRPKLEYAISVWNPWLHKDEDVLEKVQKRLVRMLSDVRAETYEEKLKLAGLTTLRERRLRGDMIETFKTMRGINHVEREDWFSIQVDEEHRPTRTNTLIVDGEVVRKLEVLVREQASLEVRRNFFTVRVEKTWNQLPEEIKAQKTVNGFKNHYDKWRKKHSVEQGDRI